MRINEPTLVIFTEKYPKMTLEGFMDIYNTVNTLPPDYETPENLHIPEVVEFQMNLRTYSYNYDQALERYRFISNQPVGKKINAIKEFRTKYNASLAEGKDVVEAHPNFPRQVS